MLEYKVIDLPSVDPNNFAFKTWKANEHLGVEFEVEGMKLPSQEDMKLHWYVKHDGSLRAPEGGQAWEYVLKKPVAPEYFFSKSFPYLLRRFKTKSAEPRWSIRCSTHIHVGVHQLYLYQVFAMAALYYVMEELFIPLVGDNRDGNLFCIDTRNSDAIIETIAQTAIDFNVTPLLTSNNYKYTAVNFRTLCNLGTLEFRAMEGTLDKQRIKIWIDFLTALRSYCMNMAPQDIPDLLNKMSIEGPLNIIRDIAGGKDTTVYKYLKKYFTNIEIDQLVYSGIGRVQRVFYEPDWAAVKPKKKLEPDDLPKQKAKTKATLTGLQSSYYIEPTITNQHIPVDWGELVNNLTWEEGQALTGTHVNNLPYPSLIENRPFTTPPVHVPDAIGKIIYRGIIYWVRANGTIVYA